MLKRITSGLPTGEQGEAKAAGNYAAAILPTEKAKLNGYDQVLWLDAHDFEFVQEAGTMNLFFKIDGKVVTPNLGGSILSGITRLSVIDPPRFGVTTFPSILKKRFIVPASCTNSKSCASSQSTWS